MKSIFPILIFILLVGAVVGIALVSKKDKKTETNQAVSSVVDESDSGSVAGVNTSNVNPEELAKYLTSKGIILYGAYWCPHCQDQKKLFGDALQYVTYYECDPKGENSKADACTAAGIEGYPTWIIDGQKYSGTKTLDELADLSGFKP